jgi:endo-1,4-beta-xylanase
MKRLLLVGVWLISLQLRAQHSNQPKELLKNSIHFQLGVSVNPKLLQENSAYKEIVRSEFNSITAENHMKMVHLHPEANRFDFQKADELIEFAQKNQMRVHGHTLVWHNQVPKWMNEFSGDQTAWENLLKNHIQTIVSHFKGKVEGWDVVNEAFLDNGELRPTIWSNHIPDYLAKCFEWAHEADPASILFYNDYGQDGHPKKLEAILMLVERLKKRQIPIHGLGLQMHISTQSSPDKLSQLIKKSVDTGLKIHFSELDIAVNPKNDSLFVYDEAQKSKQLASFEFIFKAYQAIPKTQQYGLTFWNVSDKDSWLRSFFKRPKEYPLLFDELYQVKSIYPQLVNQLNKILLTN